MQKLRAIAAVLVALVALAACTPAPIFTMEGTYEALLTITESTNPSVIVGNFDTVAAIVNTTNDTVSMQLDGMIALTGERSGNTVTLVGALSLNTIEMTLTWTGDDAFEGTGRVDYDDSTYAEFTVTGEAAVLVTSLGGSGVFGLGE